MSIGLIVAIVVILVLVIGMIYVGQRENTGEDPLEKRLIEYGDRPEPTSLSEIEQSLSFRDRVMVPLFKGLANLVTRFTPEQQIEATRRQLELAGKAQTTDPRVFFGQRLMLTVLMGGGAFAVFAVLSHQSLWLPLTVGGAALGFFLPALQLKGQVTRRQQGIVRDLPDALDLMTICVEAGLTFDMAMSKVYEKWDNDLATSFGRVLAEIQLGKTRREALRDMSTRMDVPDVTSFVAAIIQADQLGVSIAKILRVQSDQMRVKRRQRAQEKAQQAPIKMMIPMVFLIFPSIWIVLLGPSIIILLHTSELGKI
ncbi:MAG: type II secretion system F family protein [Aggregatilineales bacterium]